MTCNHWISTLRLPAHFKKSYLRKLATLVSYSVLSSPRHAHQIHNYYYHTWLRARRPISKTLKYKLLYYDFYLELCHLKLKGLNSRWFGKVLLGIIKKLFTVGIDYFTLDHERPFRYCWTPCSMISLGLLV